MEKTLRYYDKNYLKPLEDWLTLTEVAALLGHSRQCIHQQLDTGKWPQDDLRRSGDRVMFRRSTVMKRLES